MLYTHMIETAADLVGHLAGASKNHSYTPEELLRGIEGESINAQGLADKFEISRSSVHRALDPLVDQYVLFNQNGMYSWTGLSEVYLKIFDNTLAGPSVTRPVLQFLFASPARLPLLRSIRAAPATKAELSRGDDAPSRITVYRNLSEFKDYGWITTDEEGKYVLTESGQTVLSSVNTLIKWADAAMAQAEVLYGCREIKDLPLEPLTEAEMYLDTPDTPHSTASVARKLADPSIETLYSMCSIVSYEYADVWDPVIRSDTKIEMIITERVLRNLPTEGPYSEHVRRGLEAENLTILVDPDLEYLPVGLGIIDGEILQFGTPHHNSTKNFDVGGMIVSEDPGLIEWGQNMYDRYRERARPPASHVIERIKQKVSESMSSTVPDSLSWRN